MSNSVNCKLNVNGIEHNLNISEDRPLLFVLRNDLNLKGTKLGCGLEQCGSCTVLINGKKTLSCNQNAMDFIDKEIITIEGLEKNNKLSLIQEAFIEYDAAQCGYCTSGIIMSVTSLFNDTKNPNKTDIVNCLDGNLCRCGSHASVFRAIEKVKSKLNENFDK